MILFVTFSYDFPVEMQGLLNCKLGNPDLVCIFAYLYVTKLKIAPLRLYEWQQSLATVGIDDHTGSIVSHTKLIKKGRNKDENSKNSREDQGVPS